MKERLRAAWLVAQRLSTREQALIAVFAALVAAVLIARGIVAPAVAMREGLQRRASALASDLDAIAELAARIESLDAQLRAQGAASGSGKDFSLFAFVEKATARSVRRESVSAMNPSRRALPDGREEALVEVRLSGSPLSEVVALLREIERAGKPAYVKRLELKRRYDDHSRFDATVVVGALGAS